MIANTEIDSFMSKFKHLLHNGFQATLTFVAKDKEAFVTLKAGLGLCYDYNVAVKSDVVHRHSHSPKPRSPAYQRRQEKRRVEKLFKEACVEKKHGVVIDGTAGGMTAKVVNSIDELDCTNNIKSDASNIENTVKSNEFSNIDTTEKDVEAKAMDVVNNSEAKLPLTAQVEEESSILRTEPISTDNRNCSDNSLQDNTDADDNLLIENESSKVNEVMNDDDVDVSVVEKLSEIVHENDDSVAASAEVTVYATVNFDHSPRDVLSSNDLKTIEGIVYRHEHLRRNIKKLEFGSYDTGRGNDGYHHRLSLKLYVDTSCLWNNPRTYIWKFLGQDEWKTGNGTMVTLNRINIK